MYSELKEFACHALSQKSLWKDGELWTSTVGGLVVYVWFSYDPGIVWKVREHFGDLLTATSIVFGFALAALLFYIQAAGAWSNDPRVARVANKIVDWHVLTILCLLFLIGYLIALWCFGVYLDNRWRVTRGLYAFLAFLFLYCGLQILNHTLTIWWSFRTRDQLNSKVGSYVGKRKA